MRNRFDDIVDGFVDRMLDNRDKAAKTNAVPFGKERVSRKTARDRIAKMSPGEREALLAEIGAEELLGIVREE